MADVARAAGVSLKTVSRVVNHEPHTRPEVVERVTRAIAELGWVAHGGARAMRTGRTDRIAIAVSSLENPSTTMLVEALAAEAGRRGLAVGLEPTHNDPERAARVLASCGRLYDGVLVLGEAAAGVSPDAAPGAVVTVQGAHRGPGRVGSDLDAAAGVLVRHVATMRRRRVVLLGLAPREPAGGAEEADGGTTLIDAVRRALPQPPVAVLALREDSRATGAEAAETLLGDHPDADAVLCETDEIALGLLSALARRGVPLPGRIAITGFGATEDGRYTTPSLTTVDPGYPVLAREALDALEARLAGRPVEIRRPTPIELIRRESTLGTVLG